MKSSRYSTSRQKACDCCMRGKTKCDKDPAGCSRCRQRGLLCTYPHDAMIQDLSSSNRANEREHNSQGTTLSGSNVLEGHETLLVNDVSSNRSEVPPTTSGPQPLSFTVDQKTTTTDHFDFSALNLVCTINVDDIASRWLNTYVPVAGQVIKDYPPRISDLIRRMLKSYAASVVRGHNTPPFIHSSQISHVSSMPLATCLNMVRICQNPVPGSQAAAAGFLQQEMSNIYERRLQCNPMELLATFQAYLIYAMVLFLRLEQASTPFLRQAMINLQDLAWSTTRHGVLCLAEQQNLRPTWEEWIVTEAKRRTLYVMYMFDDVISKQEGIPTFLGVELVGLPAPGSKSLWQAPARRRWQERYNLHLADWPEGGLRIDELWAIPPDLDEDSILQRRSRVEQWLEDLDEFGMMIYTVTSCTHGT